MRAATVSVVALPLLSRAGVKRALAVSNLQVALSSAPEPLDEVTEQAVTRPFGPTVRRKPVTPSSSARSAEAG